MNVRITFYFNSPKLYGKIFGEVSPWGLRWEYILVIISFKLPNSLFDSPTRYFNVRISEAKVLVVAFTFAIVPDFTMLHERIPAGREAEQLIEFLVDGHTPRDAKCVVMFYCWITSFR